MICYKDMTFCSAEECTNFPTCHRALTKEVIEAAKIWWKNGDPPIAQFIDPIELDCYRKE